ncbi:hypothetical protein [Marmoricola sp. RAF53]|uniref:hypothetical protein n=1 Tax=Marmoricola sp. RAF53 TaxID=3233059 RepID=UPI003F97110C
MTEPTRPGGRRTGMRNFRVLGAAALLAFVAGCGSSGDSDASGSASSPEVSNAVCPHATGSPDFQLDLDGDGTPDDVAQVPASGGCPAVLEAHVGDDTLQAELDGDLPVTSFAAVRFTGRDGDVLLTTQAHPRGGSQTRLFGYDARTFAELLADGKPVFDFVATDAPTEHVSAACTADGFAVTEAVAHQPAGVVPAWDVYRTPYAVAGNDVTAGARTEVDDNVLESQLPSKYPDVVKGAMFENCRAGVN